jgi:serine/alanine adding enzyme
MRPATEAEMGEWDALIAAEGDTASVLQGKAFAGIKRHNGWKPNFIMHTLGQREVPVLYLSRRIMGLGELWYAPGGPSVTNAADLVAVIGQAKELPAFLVQFEPELARELAPLDALRPHGIIQARAAIQPNIHTVVIDLSPEAETLIDSFHTKTRYNIRLAERKGVIAGPVELTTENMAIMYTLMESAQSRGGYYLRSKGYFEQAWQAYAKEGSGQLFLARFEGKVLAGAFVTYLGQKALYKDGGSIREHREVQPMYALQWAVMQWLKQHGVTRYDLHGTPPSDELDDPHHPLAGLARFKTGFNPHVTEYSGVLDLPLNQSAYRRWRQVGERVYSVYLNRVKRQSLY